VYQQVVTTRQREHVRVQTANGTELVELIPLVQPTRSGITVVGVLQLNTSLRLVDSLLARLRLLLIAGTLLAAVATIALSIPLIRAVLAPLRRMAATSRAIAAGDLHRLDPALLAAIEGTSQLDTFHALQSVRRSRARQLCCRIEGPPER